MLSVVSIAARRASYRGSCAAPRRSFVGLHGVGAVLLAVCTAGRLTAQSHASPDRDRMMTVADVIGLSTFGSQPHGYRPQDVDALSPDERLHAVVVKRGDLAHNANIFTLLLFRTDHLFIASKPDTVLALPSISNRPAISHLTWLADSHTLAFLGERQGELPQVYTLETRTRRLTQRTHVATELTGFAIAPSGYPILYAAKPPVDTSGYGTMRQHGFALQPTQDVGDVLEGAWYSTVPSWSVPSQLLVSHAGALAPVRASEPGKNYRSCDANSVSMAPGGRLALLQCTRFEPPVHWMAYREPYLAKLLAGGYVPTEFALLDLDRGTVQPLFDAPQPWTNSATFRWGPTGESLVFANAFLPLDVADSAERQIRMARRGIAEVDVRTRRLTVIAHRDLLDVVAWDAATGTVDLVASRYGAGPVDGPRVRYRKTTSGWVEVRGGQVASHPVLVVEQGLNLSPRLVAVDRDAERRVVVLNPNPQLAQLRLGREQIVRWRAQSGSEHTGGLYYPPDFVRGHRYPLVIQTHGFDSVAFAPDGTFPTANAAQPMAARGMLVLQLGAGDEANTVENLMTPREAPHAMEEIEGAIDHLDSLGLINRSAVGLIGFSRTCYHVLYTLTHSPYPIAAAAISDGVDLSYLQYLVLRSAQLGAGMTLDEYAAINGGPPLGKTLDLWRERAPGFNLDRVTAPLRLEAIGLLSVLQEWEPYAGLLLQRKPVELLVIPEGAHLLVKPWERMASSQSNVDWFRFWLQGEEDPDPAKREQYARWHELRKLQQLQAVGDTAAAEHSSSQ